jgi:predicted nucleotidyltransferase
MLDVKAREGDLIETSEGLIFDVKGLVHPHDRIVAFLRFHPNENGDRKRNALTYRKVYSLSERYSLLREKFPTYLVRDPVFDETLCEVPFNKVKKHFDPAKKLQQMRNSKTLDAVEKKALQLTELLKQNSNIPWSTIGISGSILAGLHKTDSDIDPIVYGSPNCRRVHSSLQEMSNDPDSPLKLYSQDELRSLFDFRSKDTAMDFDEFVRTESRKAFQGKFTKTDYFIRFVKNWDETDEKYGDIQYKNNGYAKIKATVVDDSESIFTPCRYAIKSADVMEGPKLSPITEIASFRGRFCEQARNGETVIAQGKVEGVTDLKRDQEHFRLLIGNKPSDFMILA